MGPKQRCWVVEGVLKYLPVDFEGLTPRRLAAGAFFVGDMQERKQGRNTKHNIPLG